MPEPVFIALCLVTCLLVKHMIADYALQSPFMFKNKGRYGHPGGLLHAAVHVALTAPVLLILPPHDLKIAGYILAAEFITHYHIDWGKEQICASRSMDHTCRSFWVVHLSLIHI